MDGAKKSSQIIDRTGQIWGQYRIVSSLEQGRFSRAYLGEHLSSSKQFVIDILPMPLAREQIDIFLRQARELTRLTHQHILRLIDVGAEDFVPFLVFDYVSHVPLRQLYQQEKKQSLGKLLPYLKQAVAALQHVHDTGCLHKNLRPENILLGWNSGTLLCDFAIDVLAQNEQYQNYQRTKNIVDAMAYVAPEQIQRQASSASDQYALGIMVYEWLSGTTPFQGSYFELAKHHLHTDPPRLREKVPDVSLEVDEVIMTALAKDPQRRFGSVAVFMKALEQAFNPGSVAIPATPIASPLPSEARQMQHDPVSPLPSSVPAPLSTSATMAAGPAAPTVVSSGATPVPVPIMAGAPVLMPVKTPLPPDPLHARVPPRTMAGSPVLTQTARRPQAVHTTRRAFIAVAGAATFGGVGAWLLWQRLRPPVGSETGLNGTETTTTKQNLAPGEPQLIYREHRARVNALAWSPDGKRFVSAGDGKQVLVYDIAGKKTIQIYKGHTDRVYALAWSPDGKLIASAGADKTVQVWNAENGESITTYTGHTAAVNCVAWSSDSRIVASGSDDTTVQVWFPVDGSLFLYYEEHRDRISAVAWSPDDTKIVSASWDTAVHVFSTIAIRPKNILIGDNLFTYQGHRDEVYAVAWSPDGQNIASAGAGRVVQLCNGNDGSAVVSDGSEIEARPHRASVRSLSWSFDGQFLVAADDNKEVRIWDIVTPVPDRPLYAFKNHSDAVLAVAWAPLEGSALIISASADKTVQLWEADI